MTEKEQLGIRLRLIASFTDLMRSSGDVRSQTRKLLLLMDIYQEDTRRRLADRIPELSDLTRLTTGVLLAEQLMEPFADKREQMRGWYFGCEPANLEQNLYGILFGAAYTFTQSMMDLEAEWVN